MKRFWGTSENLKMRPPASFFASRKNLRRFKAQNVGVFIFTAILNARQHPHCFSFFNFHLLYMQQHRGIIRLWNPNLRKPQIEDHISTSLSWIIVLNPSITVSKLRKLIAQGLEGIIPAAVVQKRFLFFYFWLIPVTHFTDNEKCMFLQVCIEI